MSYRFAGSLRANTFRTVPLSIIRSFSLYTSNCIYHTGLLTTCEQTCFGQFLCPSSGVFHSTHSSGICHIGLLTTCEQTCFGQFLCPSSGIFHCTHSNDMSYRFADSLRASSQQTCMYCCVYSEKLLMMGRGTVRNMFARMLSANLYDIYHCCVYSEKLLMMDRETVRNR